MTEQLINAVPAPQPLRSGSTESDPDVLVWAEGIGFDYGSFQAVRDFHITVRRGELIALLGANGAGKTTALDILQGFRRPTMGRVRVHGVDPAAAPGHLRRHTGAVLQQAGFVPELTVTETVRMYAAVSTRHDDVGPCLERVGLSHRATTAVASLSGGERRRLDLATATWGRPALVIMDEPTTGLDPASRRTLWVAIEDLLARGTSVLLTTHYLGEVEALAHGVVIMKEGSVALAGSVADLVGARPAQVTAQLGAGIAPPPPRPGLSVDPPGPDGSRQLRWECADLTRPVHELTGWAMDNGVELHRLRATEASLEDVFHAVLDGQGAASGPRPDTEVAR